MDGGGAEVEVDFRPKQVTEGEFAGWLTWAGGDPFEDQTGPFYFREEADESVRCAFRAERRHMNGGGFMHGGCMLTFADFCLFAFSEPLRRREGWNTPTVTVSLNGEFVGPAREGDLVEAKGEVVRAGASLLFIRGLLLVRDRPILNFSGVIKKVRPRKG